MDAVQSAYLGDGPVTELLQFTLFGLMLGCVYAIAAMGLVLTYTVTGVFNFAHGAVGMIAAFVLLRAARRPTACPRRSLVVIVVLVFAPLDRAGRRAPAAPVPRRDYATSLVVTIALTVGLLGLAQKVFPEDVARNAPFLFGDHRIALLSRARSPTTASPRSSSPSRSPSACASCCSARRSAPACARWSTTPSWPASAASGPSPSPGTAG